jgi:hypothetical protein
MTRRIVLAVTAFAVIGGGAVAASATTATHSSAPGSVKVSPDHQLCLLLYREDPKPQHICVNW